jgi:hypothetical protein
MTSVHKRIALALVAAVATAVASSVFAQTAELNPTVKVLSRPQSPVPAECATDTNPASAQPAPQTTAVAEPQPVATAASVPPSNALRASLRRLQTAADGDDYAAFKAAFDDAKRAIAAYPPGGERNAANDAFQVFADIGRVWDYAMASPAGSFFDGTVQGGSLLSALRRYPDYGRTIAGETVAAGDRTLYPTSETRRFLARESERRLARMGVSVSTRVAQGTQPEPPPRRVTPAPQPVTTKPAEVRTKTAATSKTTPKTAQTTPKTTQAAAAPKPRKTEHKPSEKTAAQTTTPKVPAPESTPLPKPKPPATPPVKVAATTAAPPVAVPTPAPARPPVSKPSPPSPPPAAATTTTAAPPPAVATTTTAVAPAPLTSTTTTTAPATGTTSSGALAASSSTTSTSTTDTAITDTASTTPDTAGSGTTAPEKQNGNMNLIWAVVLILVGIGVLVILFRASD